VLTLYGTSQVVDKEMKKEGESSNKLTKARDKATSKVAKLKSELESLEFSEDEYALLDREKQELEASIAELNQLIDTLNTKLAAKLSFKYQDPVRGFDRSKIKGLVSKLIAVRDSKNSTALEVVAGGKLYQVVVDEAITGKALLDRGKLERRVTLIPLDKIKSRPLGRETCREADRIAGDLGANAAPAIDLVEFDEEVRSAIEYVFGSSIVVDSAEAANRVCEATKTRTVTLEGDTYDPSGTISGGSRDAIGSTLTNLYDLKRASQELNEKQARFRVLQEKLSSMEVSFAKFEKISGDLSVADAELSNAVKHLSQTSFGVLAEKRETMAKDLEAAEREQVEMEKESTEKRELYEALKGRESQLTQERENKLQELEHSLQRAKVEATEKSKRANEVRIRFFTCMRPPLFNSDLFFLAVRPSRACKTSSLKWPVFRMI
jgi:structural maintenance of chromosome 2